MSLYRKTQKLAASTSMLAMAISGAAVAQDDDTFELEEIVVTAQKREQSMQDVPISLNAFSGNFMDTIAAENITDLSIYTPGLEISGVTQPNFKMRGVQTSDFGVGTDGAVAVYIDGVYSTRSGSSIMQLSDVARVEVLKGPQGTLFGRNTAAGAVSVTTNKPNTEAVEGFVKMRYGRFDKKQLNAMLNYPISETVALRFNGQINRRDGHVNDAITGKDYGTQNNETGRVQLRWEPGDDTSLTLAYEFDRTNQDENPVRLGVGNGQVWYSPDAETIGDIFPHGQVLPTLFATAGIPITAGMPVSALQSVPFAALLPALQSFGYNPANAGQSWDFIRDANTPGGANPVGKVVSDIAGGTENRALDGVNLRIEHDFGDMTLNSISSYKEFSSNNLQEEDGTADPDFYFDTDNIEENKQYYQELRLNYTSDSFTWALGGSYYRENAYQRSNTKATTNSIDTTLYNVGATPAVLAQGLNLADGINNPCENAYFDSLSGYVGFTSLPMACFDPSLGAMLAGALGSQAAFASIEDLANMVGTSWYGRDWVEDMIGEGKTRSWGVFFDGTWHATDRMNVTAGIRYTKDKKSWAWLNGPRTISDAYQLNVPGLGNLADIHQQFMTAVLGGTGDLVFNLNRTFADENGQVVTISEGGVDGFLYQRSDSWDYLSPRVVVDYAVNDDIMVFGSWTMGHKAGGHNSQEPGSVFDNEEVTNVELGMKSMWLDGTLRLNTSVWKYKYNDKQSISLRLLDGASIPTYVRVTEDVGGQGLDLDLTWAVNANLRLFAAAGYQDITCEENCGRKDVGEPTGEPSKRISVGLDYGLPLGNGKGAVNFHVDHSYTSATRENSECLALGNCGIVTWGGVSWETGKAKNFTNARINWTNEEGNVDFGVFAKNIFNKQYLGGAGGLLRDTMYAPMSSLQEPWSWGVDLNYKF